jgi:hypothetical protein
VLGLTLALDELRLSAARSLFRCVGEAFPPPSRASTPEGEKKLQLRLRSLVDIRMLGLEALDSAETLSRLGETAYSAKRLGSVAVRSRPCPVSSSSSRADESLGRTPLTPLAREKWLLA